MVVSLPVIKKYHRELNVDVYFVLPVSFTGKRTEREHQWATKTIFSKEDGSSQNLG